MRIEEGSSKVVDACVEKKRRGDDGIGLLFQEEERDEKERGRGRQVT